MQFGQRGTKLNRVLALRREPPPILDTLNMATQPTQKIKCVEVSSHFLRTYCVLLCLPAPHLLKRLMAGLSHPSRKWPLESLETNFSIIFVHTGMGAEWGHFSGVMSHSRNYAFNTRNGGLGSRVPFQKNGGESTPCSVKERKSFRVGSTQQVHSGMAEA